MDRQRNSIINRVYCTPGPPPAGAPDHCVCVAALLYTSKYWREFLFNMDDLNNVDFVDV